MLGFFKGKDIEGRLTRRHCLSKVAVFLNDKNLKVREIQRGMLISRIRNGNTYIQVSVYLLRRSR